MSCFSRFHQMELIMIIEFSLVRCAIWGPRAKSSFSFTTEFKYKKSFLNQNFYLVFRIQLTCTSTVLIRWLCSGMTLSKSQVYFAQSNIQSSMGGLHLILHELKMIYPLCFRYTSTFKSSTNACQKHTIHSCLLFYTSLWSDFVVSCA